MEPEDETNGAEDGLQYIASLVRAVLSRIKISLKDVQVRLEQQDASTGETLALVVTVSEITYRDSTSGSSVPGLSADQDGGEDLAPVAVTEKEISLHALSASLVESKPREFTKTTRVLMGSAEHRPDLLRIKVHHGIAGAEPRTECSLFLHMFNALLSPGLVRKLQLLVSVFTKSSETTGHASAKATRETDATHAQSGANGPFQFQLKVGRGGVSLLLDDHPREVHNRVAQVFFQTIGDLDRHKTPEEYSRDACTDDNPLIPACGRDHVRLSFRSFIADFFQRAGRDTTADLSIGRLAVHECTFRRDASSKLLFQVHPVLAFDQSLRPPASVSGSARDTDVNGMPFAARRYPTHGSDRGDHSTKDVSVIMQLPSSSREGTPVYTIALRPVVFTLDVTLIDRMYWYMNLHPADSPAKTALLQPLERVGLVAVAAPEVAPPDAPTFSANCSFLRLILVAPIPDFRETASPGANQPKDRPTKPSLRSSEVWMDFVGVAVENAPPLVAASPTNPRGSRRRPGHQSTAGNELPLHRQFGFQLHFSQLCGYVRRNSEAEAIGFLNVEGTNHRPALSIVVEGRKEPQRSPHIYRAHGASAEVRVGAGSSRSRTGASSRPAPGPFSAKFVAREGQERSFHPAAFPEAEKYRQAFTRRSEFQVDVALGSLHCHLRKDTLGLVYSHLIDVSMWEMWAPPVAGGQAKGGGTSSGLPRRSLDVETESIATETTYLSPRMSRPRSSASGALSTARNADATKRGEKLPGAPSILPHLLGLTVTAGKADLTLEETTDYRSGTGIAAEGAAPAEAEFTKRFTFGLQDIALFTGVGVHGTLLKHVVLHVRQVTLVEADGLHGTGCSCIDPQPPSDGHMLALAVSIDVNNAFATPLKILTLAVDLDSLLLKHRVTPAGQHWLLRLMDLTELVDPVWEGYKAADRMMKVHLRLLDLVVMYQPIGIKEAALLSVESLQLNANIVPQSPVSVLSFVFDQFRCKLLPDQEGLAAADDDAARLKLPWVQVAHDPELALAIRTCSDGSRPKLEVEVTNHRMTVETCSDSFASFASVLGYYFRSGDLDFVSRDTPRDGVESSSDASGYGESPVDGPTPSSSWNGLASSADISSILLSSSDGVEEAEKEPEKDAESPGGASPVEGEEDVFQSAIEHWGTSSVSSDVSERSEVCNSPKPSAAEPGISVSLPIPMGSVIVDTASESSLGNVTVSSSETAMGRTPPTMLAGSASSTPTPQSNLGGSDGLPNIEERGRPVGAPFRVAPNGASHQPEHDTTAADLLEALGDISDDSPKPLAEGEALSFVDDYFVSTPWGR